jgi:HAD superfamily hydrolase (TIGR01509 family)
MSENNKIVVLDAMGVIYAVGDDVRDLLYPFITEKGGCPDYSKILALYRLTSLGKLTSAEFWTKVGIDPGLEDEYLQRIRLIDGLLDFLTEIRRDHKVFCLSNDVSEWSKKLRNRWGLTQFFQGFVVSGDVGFRKPDPAIFQKLLDSVEVSPEQIIFVDDIPGNLDSAASLGFKTILFRSTLLQPYISDITGNSHKIAVNYNQLKSLLT